MSKYAPPAENGWKPYVVVVYSWGKESERIGWGDNPTEAKWDGAGRLGTGEYVAKVRRATPADMERLA